MIRRINALVFAPEAVARVDNPTENTDDTDLQDDEKQLPLPELTEMQAENRGTLILDEAWDKTHHAEEIAEYFSVNKSTVYRLVE